MLARPRLCFSHLREHKLRHGFKDTLNPLCSCSMEAETTTYYFLRCQFYNSHRVTLMNDLGNIPISFPAVSDHDLSSLLLHGYLEAVTQRCSVKKVFLKISQNSQENTCARVSFLIKLQV